MIDTAIRRAAWRIQKMNARKVQGELAGALTRLSYSWPIRRLSELTRDIRMAKPKRELRAEIDRAMAEQRANRG